MPPVPKFRREDLKPGEWLCSYCTAKCCRYFALPIDTPTTWQDFDYLRWFMMHGRVSLFVEGETWYLMVYADCQHLLPDNRCGTYETRPPSAARIRQSTASTTTTRSTTSSSRRPSRFGNTPKPCCRRAAQRGKRKSLPVSLPVLEQRQLKQRRPIAVELPIVVRKRGASRSCRSPSSSRRR